eukprot:SAG11_NODE_28812_length_317_cov_1.701835_1_plen_105_part_11
MAVKDIDTDEGKTITVTNVFGIKQNTSGWMEPPTDGTSSENLEHKVYPGPDTTSPDSFYQRILNTVGGGPVEAAAAADALDAAGPLVETFRFLARKDFLALGRAL